MALPAYAGRHGTLSPDTPSQRPKGLWEPVFGAVDQAFGLIGNGLCSVVFREV